MSRSRSRKDVLSKIILEGEGRWLRIHRHWGTTVLPKIYDRQREHRPRGNRGGTNRDQEAKVEEITGKERKIKKKIRKRRFIGIKFGRIRDKLVKTV